MADFNVDLDDIRRIKDGDKHRFKKLLNKYSVLIESVKSKYDAEGYDEDDFAQIARISIWKAVLAFDEGKIDDHSKVPNQLTKLIKKIVHNDIGSIFNWREQKKRCGVEVEFDEKSFPAEHDYDNKLFLMDISRLFGGVRVKIISFIILGYTQEEIAEKLDLSRVQVSRQLSIIKKLAFC